MNILIASNNIDFISSITAIDSLFKKESQNFSVIETLDELIFDVKSQAFDLIITETYFDGIDCWLLSNIIFSERFAPFAIPLVVIKQDDDIDILPDLSRKHGFHIVDGSHAISLSEAVLSIFDGYLQYKTKGIPYSHFKRPSILIIEEDELSAKMMSLTLSDFFRVHKCYDGITGLQHYRQYQYDLVLLDAQLLSINGEHVLDIMMQINHSQAVITLTSDTDTLQSIHFILKGARQHLTKPISSNDLIYQCFDVIKNAQSLNLMASD